MLTTARLLLRPWRPADREPYAAMNQDPEVMRFFPGLQPPAASARSIELWNAELDERGFSNWALEVRDSGRFIGFTGLTVPRRELPFSPCVEIGWRLARDSWHRGYATEAAVAALAFGFGPAGLAEIVSFTARLNLPSQAVMRRAGLHDSGRDFEHPALPPGHALRRHCLYLARRETWQAPAGA